MYNPELRQATLLRYKQRHPDRIAASKKAWKLRNADKLRVANKSYNDSHKVERHAEYLAYRASHPDRFPVVIKPSPKEREQHRREHRRAWSRRNREKINVQQKEWRRIHPDKLAISRAKHREWRTANKKRCCAIQGVRRARKYAHCLAAKVTAEQIALRWHVFGNKCYLCGKPAEATDHVKPLAKGGAHLLCNLRPICHSCNARKNASWPYLLGETPCLTATPTP